MNRPDGGMQNQQETTDHNRIDQSPSLDEDSSDLSQQAPLSNSDSTENNTETGRFPQTPGGQMQGGTHPDFANRQDNAEQSDSHEQMHNPSSNNTPNNSGQMSSQEQDTETRSAWLIIGISVLILAFGLTFAFILKRRK